MKKGINISISMTKQSKEELTLVRQHLGESSLSSTIRKSVALVLNLTSYIKNGELHIHDQKTDEIIRYII